jgi:hypothetical protein
LVDLWERTKKSEPKRAFRAIVDTRDQIIAHTEIERVGKTALPVNRERPTTRKRDDRIEWRRDPALAGEESYIEIRIPIRKFRGTAGYYVSGIASDWIATKVFSEQYGAIVTWSIVICSATIIVAYTGVTLYRLAKRASQLEQELQMRTQDGIQP